MLAGWGHWSSESGPLSSVCGASEPSGGPQSRRGYRVPTRPWPGSPRPSQQEGLRPKGEKRTRGSCLPFGPWSGEAGGGSECSVWGKFPHRIPASLPHRRRHSVGQVFPSHGGRARSLPPGLWASSRQATWARVGHASSLASSSPGEERSVLETRGLGENGGAPASWPPGACALPALHPLPSQGRGPALDSEPPPRCL